MPRISISLTNEIYKKLEKRAMNNGEQAISQCANELIELGLRVEEAAEKNRENSIDEPSLIEEIQTIKMMLENNMIWSVESRAYARYFMESLPNQPREKNVELAKFIQAKAKETIKNKTYLQKNDRP